MRFWQFGSILRQTANKAHFYNLNSVVTLKFGQSHLEHITTFPHPNNGSLAVRSKSMYWFTRYTADTAHFYSLNSMVALKIGSRSPNSDQICSFIPMIQYMKLSLNPSLGSRDRVQTSLC